MELIENIDLKDQQVVRVARAKCLESLAFHTRYFFHTVDKKKFIMGEHHQKICDALEDVLRGRCKRLIISMPPRYGKTELAVKSFIAHGLALNPSAKFIHLSYGDAIALDNSEAIKDLIESEEYQRLFPDVKIKRDSKAKEKWYTTEGGGVLARAAAGQVTGFGAGQVDTEEQAAKDLVQPIYLDLKPLELDNIGTEDNDDEADSDIEDFVDLIGSYDDLIGAESPLEEKLKFNGAIIIDDPIKPEDADQEIIREKVNNRFDSTIRNRVNSRNTPIIVIMHRLHPNDLSGYLQREDEADEWRVLSLPALIEDEQGEEATIDGVTKKWRALWPHKHTVTELLKLAKANEIVFGRQYQQDPSPKHGLLFPEKDLKLYDHDKMMQQFLDPDFCLLAADPADEGGDDFAGATAPLIGDEIFITNVIYNTDGTDINEPRIEAMIMNKENSVRDVAVEGVFGWKETATRIRERVQSEDKYGTKRYGGEFRIVRPRTNKHSRILNRASFIKNHFRFRKDWQKFPQYAKFMRNLMSYLRVQEAGKGNKHDDAPDLCEMIAAYYEKTFSHLW